MTFADAPGEVVGTPAALVRFAEVLSEIAIILEFWELLVRVLPVDCGATTLELDALVAGGSTELLAAVLREPVALLERVPVDPTVPERVMLPRAELGTDRISVTDDDVLFPPEVKLLLMLPLPPLLTLVATELELVSLVVCVPFPEVAPRLDVVWLRVSEVFAALAREEFGALSALLDTKPVLLAEAG